MPILLALIVCSCSNDEAWADNYITNFVEMQTNDKGNVTSMRLDNGEAYMVENGLLFETPDTTYRCICIYTTEGNHAMVADYQQAVSHYPLTYTQGQPFKTDPCEIQSVWISGKYINARIMVQGKDKAHGLWLYAHTLADNTNGSKTLTLRLYHDQNGDSKAFTRTFALSCPLDNYFLRHNFDSVCLIAPKQTYSIVY